MDSKTTGDVLRRFTRKGLLVLKNESIRIICDEMRRQNNHKCEYISLKRFVRNTFARVRRGAPLGLLETVPYVTFFYTRFAEADRLIRFALILILTEKFNVFNSKFLSIKMKN